MSDFSLAIPITLKHEGGFFHVQATGEVVNMGITLATLRSLGVLKSSGPPTEADLAFVKSLTQDEAEQIYREEYWDKLNLSAIHSQDVAAKVFDMAVNMGPAQTVKLLQAALVVVTIDGVMGPRTIAATNAAEPNALLALIRTHGKQFYTELAASSPVLAPNLAGWIGRLNS